MEQMVKQIMGVLTGVGFPGALEWAVQVHLCFAPQKFTVQHEQFRGGDQLRYQVCIVRDEGSGTYLPSYYDACLIRPLELKPESSCAEHLLALNQQMQLVNWEGLLDRGATATVGDMADLKSVSGLVNELRELEASEEGVLYAELLRTRYWIRTPFEVYAGSSNPLRNLFEVTQRFHFFDDGQGITLDEAYRFLLHRWREKQLLQRQKGYSGGNGQKRNTSLKS